MHDLEDSNTNNQDRRNRQACVCFLCVNVFLCGKKNYPQHQSPPSRDNPVTKLESFFAPR